MLRVAGITTRIVVQLSFQPRFKAPAWRLTLGNFSTSTGANLLSSEDLGSESGAFRVCVPELELGNEVNEVNRSLSASWKTARSTVHTRVEGPRGICLVFFAR